MKPRYEISYTQRAKSDLLKAYAFIAPDSAQHAEGMVERIMASIDLLAYFPHRTIVSHRDRRIKGEVYSLPVWPYVVFFRFSEPDLLVTIVHIRHGARRPIKRL